MGSFYLGLWSTQQNFSSVQDETLQYFMRGGQNPLQPLRSTLPPSTLSDGTRPHVGTRRHTRITHSATWAKPAMMDVWTSWRISRALLRRGSCYSAPRSRALHETDSVTADLPCLKEMLEIWICTWNLLILNVGWKTVSSASQTKCISKLPWLGPSLPAFHFCFQTWKHFLGESQLLMSIPLS